MLSYDLFQRHFTVPYLPFLGAVHPATVDEALFHELVAAGVSGDVLSYDRAIRWGNRRSEVLLSDLSDSTAEYTRFVTKDAERYRLYVYGSAQGAELSIPGSNEHEVLTFSAAIPIAESAARVTAVYLSSFSAIDGMPSGCASAVPFHCLSPDVQATLGGLVAEPENAGFEFVAERLRQGKQDGDLFVTVRNNAVVGAIGPLTVQSDNHGKMRLLPPYFGVAPSARRQKIGMHLWRAAMSWAAESGASYYVLQARTASPADHFYQRMALSCLGYIVRTQK